MQRERREFLIAVSRFNNEGYAIPVTLQCWRNIDASEHATFIHNAFFARLLVITTGNDQRSICPFGLMCLKIESVI